jgi:HicA toxin of bacterial toxin-antitoxin,
MSRCDKLLDKARRNPGGLSIAEARALAECHGFEFARTNGSHHIFKYPGRMQPLNFQVKNGNVKRYQVSQLLQAIDDMENGGG